MNKRLQQLEANIAELAALKKSISVADIKREKSKEWALRYGFLESIQIVIDVSCHLVVHKNLGNANTYSDCIGCLKRFDYIDEDLEIKLKGMVGLRNILVHEYVDIDLDQLYQMLDHLEDFQLFVKAMNKAFS